MNELNENNMNKLQPEELQSILHSIDESTIVAVTDASWNITFVNERFCKISGYTRDELLGQNHRILNSGEHSKEFWSEMYSNLNAGRTWKGTIHNRAKGGHSYWVETTISPVLDENGKLVGSVALRYDTTALHRSVEQLVATNDRARFAFKGCVEGLFQYESSSDKIWYSDRFHELLGIQEGNLGNDIAEFSSRLHPSDRQKWSSTSLEDLFKHGDWDAEFRMLNQTGKYCWYRLVSKRFIGRSEDEWSVAGSISDVEILKQREHMITQAQLAAEHASRAKMAFLSRMSHELRTPMTSIIGYLDLLDSAPNTQDSKIENTEAVSIIRRNASHLLALINDILDVSKLDAQQMTVEQIKVDPKDIVFDVIAQMTPQADSKLIDLQYEFETSLPETIDSDPTRLRQVLLNLVGNAVKFTDEGAVKINVTCDRKYHLIHFSILDTGIGMTAEQCRNIENFKAFNQADSSISRQFGGTGLGLHISHSLTGMLGGGIKVHSVEGVGSTFTATVSTGPLNPIEDTKNEHATIPTQNTLSNAPPQPAATLPLDGIHVLLAEDCLDIQRLFDVFLSRAGAQLTKVNNGREAVETALSKQHQSFDFILMDMQMPVMDGYSAAKELRQKNCQTPIIAVTAHATSGASQECLDAGCDDYLAKPISKESLLDMCIKWSKGTACQAA